MSTQAAHGWQIIPASAASKRTANPIEDVDLEEMSTNEALPMIHLSVGDPSLDGNLLPPDSAIQAISEIIGKHKGNGYGPSVGYEDARQAVADYHKKFFATNNPGVHFTAKDVILATGATHAIGLAVGALCNAGDEFLLPSPCYPAFTTIVDYNGIKPKYYECSLDKQGEINFEQMKSLITPKTRGILMNNPSNPCGTNFSRKHVEEILAFAEEHRLPIVADELYAGMVLGDEVFTSVADISSSVPRIIIGGISKNYVVPGWRLGWAIVEDPRGILKHVFDGMVALSTLIVGPCSPIQAALPQMLHGTPKTYYEGIRAVIEKNSNLTYEALSSTPGLRPVKPQGAIFIMVAIDFSLYPGFPNAEAFCNKLHEEQCVVVLPGEMFRAPPGFFRLVTSKSEDAMVEAMRRIKEFCDKYAKKN